MDFDTLESMCELIADCPHSTPKWTDEGVIVLRNQNIKNGTLNLSDPSFTDERNYQARVRRATPRAGDIVITREAPIGEVCLIPEGLKCCLGQRQVLLRAKKSVDSRYLFWALQSPFVKHQISWSEGTGSTVSNLRIPLLCQLQIPRLKNETEIATTLSTITNKIALNRQINQTLEAIAQALFKSWFVDFEPVRAKITAIETGEDPNRAAMRAISGKTDVELDNFQNADANGYAQLHATASLFPDEWVDSDLGLIPEGWEVTTLKELCSIISKGTTPSKNDLLQANDFKTIPFIKVKDITFDGEVSRTDLELIPSSIHKGALKRSILSKDDILVSIAGTIGRIAVVDEDLDGANSNQAVAFIRLKNKNQNLSIALNQLKSKRVKEAIESAVVQGVQANLSLTSLGNFLILLPESSVLNAWNSMTTPLYNQINQFRYQTRILSLTRDTLLPKLLSGELTVSDVGAGLAPAL